VLQNIKDNCEKTINSNTASIIMQKMSS